MSIEPRFEDGEVLFALRLDFEPGTKDPARVFRAMSDLIEVFQNLDSDLSRGISVAIRPVQVLHDVENGSIVAWLRTVLEQVDDEALLNLDWRPIVGQYLVRAKHAVLRWLEGRDGISSIDELEPLEQEVLELAEETAVLRFPSYAVIPRVRFPRFNGHPIIEVHKEVSDDTGAKAVSGGVPSADGGAGPSRSESGGAG